MALLAKFYNVSPVIPYVAASAMFPAKPPYIYCLTKLPYVLFHAAVPTASAIYGIVIGAVPAAIIPKDALLTLSAN